MKPKLRTCHFVISMIMVFSFLPNLKTKAQSDYTIEYTIVSGVEVDENNSLTYKYKRYGTLFINSDSLSFFKYDIKKSKKKILLKDDMSHHGILSFLKTDSIYENSTLFRKNYLVNHHWNNTVNSNWEIFNDTLNILGYTCNKAVNDSGVVAWFTDSIPVNSGPSYYHGLPGAILQVNDNKAKIVMTAKAITKESPGIIFPKKYAFISREDYHRLLDKNRPASNFTITTWSKYD